MKCVRNSMLLTLLACAVFISSGCVTQHQVKAIVAESNAAMVTPYLDKAGNSAGAGWKEAVAKIDQLIADHFDQTILVNHLRVRQAMLLTVNKQKYLAAQVWNQVAADTLTTERDRNLFKHKETLMWWYDRAPLAAPLAGDDERYARKYLSELDETMNGLKTTDISLYLGTIRAQIALKLRNDANVVDATNRTQLAHDIADDLLRYVTIFSQEDVDWVKKSENKGAIITTEGMTIANLRYRVWLRDMVLNFKDTAKRLLCRPDITEQCIPGPAPDWRPDWVKQY